MASLAILLFHATGLLSVLCASPELVGKWGTVIQMAATMSTNCFFLLAGLVSYGVVMGGRKPWRSWLVGRLWRLYPPFFVVEFFYLLASVLVPHLSKLPAEAGERAWFLAANFSMLHGVLGVGSLHVVTWTLGYNLLLYVFLPPFVSGLRLRRWSPRARLVFLCALFCVGGVFVRECLGERHGRAWIMVAGFCLWELQAQYGRRLSFLRRNEWWIGAATIVVTWFGFLVQSGRWSPGLGGAWGGFLMSLALCSTCLCCLQPGTSLGRWCSGRVSQWLGRRSYSCYLTHSFCLHVVLTIVRLGFGRHALGTVGWGIALAVSVGFALVAANAFYEGMEKFALWRISHRLTAETQQIRTVPSFTGANRAA
jgi:peptidoglycan/LPS O-acetylase OafA/YrhL